MDECYDHVASSQKVSQASNLCMGRNGWNIKNISKDILKIHYHTSGAEWYWLVRCRIRKCIVFLNGFSDFTFFYWYRWIFNICIHVYRVHYTTYTDVFKVRMCHFLRMRYRRYILCCDCDHNLCKICALELVRMHFLTVFRTSGLKHIYFEILWTMRSSMLPKNNANIHSHIQKFFAKRRLIGKLSWPHPVTVWFFGMFQIGRGRNHRVELPSIEQVLLWHHRS